MLKHYKHQQVKGENSSTPYDESQEKPESWHLATTLTFLPETTKSFNILLFDILLYTYISPRRQ